MADHEVKRLEDEIKILRKTLKSKEELLQKLKKKDSYCAYSQVLSSSEVTRYSRQIIMPQISLSGQILLKRSKVLIVGAGGLGCPSSLYLVGAGVGEIHVVDYDEVELSNLHRQVLHTEADIGIPKVQSAYEKLIGLNSDVIVVPIQATADSSIFDLVVKNKYDVILDCTDNVATRYLLNDVCVLNNVPLVSGSALQMEGQLTVYHHKDGPCYRCLFPVPPPPNTVTNCGDGGVLGAVPGVIGVLQALEAIKILLKSEGVLSGRLLIFDGVDTIFRKVKLRLRSKTCDVCGENPRITSPIDYEQFCGSKAHDKVVDITVLEDDENIDVKGLQNIMNGNNIILDVRPELEYDMCKLPNTINLPYSEIEKGRKLEILEELIYDKTRDAQNVYVLCRRGNDSQRSVQYLKKKYFGLSVRFLNIKGGLHAYSKLVDQTFPLY